MPKVSFILDCSRSEKLPVNLGQKKQELNIIIKLASKYLLCLEKDASDENGSLNASNLPYQGDSIGLEFVLKLLACGG